MIEKGVIVTTSFSQMTQRNIVMVTATMAVLLWLVGGLARWGVALSILLVVPGWWLHQYIPAPSSSRVGRLMLGAAVGPTVVAVVYMLAAAVGVAIPAWVLEWWLPVVAVLALRRLWPMLGDSMWVAPGRWWGHYSSCGCCLASAGVGLPPLRPRRARATPCSPRCGSIATNADGEYI